MTTDTSEKGLESLIVEHMTGRRSTAPPVGDMAEDPEPFIGLHNWLLGDPSSRSPVMRPIIRLVGLTPQAQQFVVE